MQHDNIEFEPSVFSDVSQESSQIANLSEINDMKASLSVPAIAYGLHRISQMPEVRNAVNEKINDCKEAINEAYENAKDAAAEKVEEARETIKEVGEKITDGIKDFCHDAYEDISEFFTGKEKPTPNASQFPASAKLSEGITEGREFGLDKCTEAALEIFNPGVINEWSNLSEDVRRGIALSYADKVAEAFELDNYRGVYIEPMTGVLGYNNGDGTIHISDSLLASSTTPFLIMDTVTHELRHQYQSECIHGLHDVSDEVRNEWAVATMIYNYDQPSCYDPWGYSYNPLEIDSNYAGNTVVRNVSSQMFNDLVSA